MTCGECGEVKPCACEAQSRVMCARCGGVWTTLDLDAPRGQRPICLPCSNAIYAANDRELDRKMRKDWP